MARSDRLRSTKPLPRNPNESLHEADDDEQTRDALRKSEASLRRTEPSTLPGTDEDRALPFLDIGPVEAVPPGEAVAFEVSGRSVVVCNAEGTLYAVADRCTHAAWPLAGSKIRAGELLCSLHGARFDLRTGKATCPPASKPLRTFAVKSANGRILARVPPPLA